MTGLEIVAAAKTSIDTSLAIVGMYKEAKKNIDQIELQTQFGELRSNILDTKENVLDLRTALMEKDEEIAKLKNELKLRKELKYEAPVYWHDAEDERDGPFCQKCFDSDKKIIRLQIHSTQHDGAWDCNVCDSHYRTRAYDTWYNAAVNSHLNKIL